MTDFLKQLFTKLHQFKNGPKKSCPKGRFSSFPQTPFFSNDKKIVK